MAAAVKLLVMDAMRNTVAVSTGARDDSSRNPAVPTCASRPSTTIPYAIPGTRDRSANVAHQAVDLGKRGAQLRDAAAGRRTRRAGPGCIARRCAPAVAGGVPSRARSTARRERVVMGSL